MGQYSFSHTVPTPVRFTHLEGSETHTQRLTPVFFLVILLSLSLCAVNLWGINRDILGLFHDDGIYTVSAKALSEGKGYRISSLPSSPPQTKYPFLYSYILSWIWWLDPAFPENIFFLKAVNVVGLFIILLLSYFFYCRYAIKRGWDVLFYVLLIGINPLFYSFTDYPLSEMLFAALCLLALFLCDPHDRLAPSLTRVILLAGVSALACLTRQAGVPLILAGIFHLLVARQRRQLFLYLVMLSALLSPWMLWQLSQATEVPRNPLLHYYLSAAYQQIALSVISAGPYDVLQIVWGNVRYLSESFDWSLFLPTSPGLRFLVYPFFVWGLFLSFRRPTVFFHTFLLLYLALILAWPWSPARYSFPLIPIALLFVFMGMQAAESIMTTCAHSQRTKWLIAILLRLPLVCIVAFNLAWLSSYLQQGYTTQTTRGWVGLQLPYGWDGFVETFTWIRAHTEEDAVLATAYDPMYYLYTGRKAIRPWLHKPETLFYPYGHPTADLGSVQEIKEALTALRVRYLVIDPLDGYAEQQAAKKLFAELLDSYPIRPELVFSSTDSLHRVYALPVRIERALEGAESLE